MLDWKRERFPYTPSVSNIYGLNESLNEILEEGLKRVFERHKISEEMREGTESMDLKLWLRREIASDTVTAIDVQGIDYKKIIEVMAQHWVLLAGSVGELEERVIWIGHMGYNAKPTNIIATIGALEGVLAELGFEVSLA